CNRASQILRSEIANWTAEATASPICYFGFQDLRCRIRPISKFPSPCPGEPMLSPPTNSYPSDPYFPFLTFRSQQGSQQEQKPLSRSAPTPSRNARRERRQDLRFRSDRA